MIVTGLKRANLKQKLSEKQSKITKHFTQSKIFYFLYI